MANIIDNLTQEEIDEMSLNEAMLLLQKTIPVIAKNSEGYGYKYASLESILEVVQESANKLGIRIKHKNTNVENNLMGISTVFVKGDEIEEGFTCYMPVNTTARDAAQQIGSVITYGRRYSLCASLSIATSDDDAVLRVNEREYNELSNLIKEYAGLKNVTVEEMTKTVLGSVNTDEISKVTQQDFNKLKAQLIRSIQATKQGK